MKEGLERALARRPEIAGTFVEVRQRSAELTLARNRMLPRIDFTAKYGRDAGVGSITKRGSEVIAGITLESPFQRRKAKGAVAVQMAKLEQLEQKLRFARDRIEVEVRDAASALDAALQRLELARAEQDAAEQMAEAERERFDLGDSTLFVVNLRELSAAGARFKVFQALADWHKAAAAYRAATADF
jgi:outer membrane protein TolC